MTAGGGISRPLPVVIKPIRWGQIALAAISIAILAVVAVTIAQSQHIQWSEIPTFLLDANILSGIRVTLELTAAAMLMGVVLGTLLAIMAVSDNIVLKTIAYGFVWCFRGVPLLVQVFFWFNIALFLPEIRLGTFAVSTNAIVTTEVASLLALGLHEASHMAEIIRSGLLSVDSGQTEASFALGLTRAKALRRIILPQAIRVILPPTGNEAIGLLKASAAVSVIGMEDLLTQAQHIYSRNFLVIELLFVAAIWYLAMTTVATAGQFFLERHFGQGFARGGPTPS
jgi:polar amino acid transport system permease protein